MIEDFSHAFERGTEPADPGDARLREVHAALFEFLARSNDNASDFAAALPHHLASLGLADVTGRPGWSSTAAAHPPCG